MQQPRLGHFARRRRAAGVVEFSIICPAALLILFGFFIGGMGVARYQEVSHLARKAARYASTHGGMYQQEANIAQLSAVPSIASVDDPNLSSYVAANAVLCDPSRLMTNVSWTAPAGYTPPNMPSYMDTTNTNPPGQVVVQNNVVVTVSYQWLPEAYLLGPITLTCTCEMPMSY